MSGVLDQVRQDAASLHGFVCSISDKCESRSGAPAYQESSERFFSYISDLAAATKSYLQDATQSTNNSPQDLLDLRAEIATLRAGWRFMHRFVKPVLDADTLRLPTSLLRGLTNRFREIPTPKFANTDFVFYHSDDFNYFNIKLVNFRLQADKIAGLVGGPRFPPYLGLVGIPYSQSESLFINYLIPHEMGHYLFGELLLRQKFCASIEQELIKLYGSSLTPYMRAQLIGTLAFWVEELFCDAFAVRIVGFCFSLAFVELFDTATVLDENAKYVRASGTTEFSVYPPDLFRLRNQVAVLSADGWWDDLVKTDSHYVRTLEAADGIDDADFTFPTLSSIPAFNPAQAISLFFRILPSILVEVNAATVGVENGAGYWKEHGELIEKYLENGVVPSSLISGGPHPTTPKPIALMNASYKFYVESLPRLLDRIEEASSDKIMDMAYWAKRVEMWTAKAIDDVILLDRGRI
jgi:hypothetical protein